ncbi:50S ribosomal protein L29 [bacterium]|nr:50S ribosomal protein L29 [bacterium]
MSQSTHRYLKSIQGKSDAELRDLVGELKGKQFDNRFERSMGRLVNYRLVPETKRKLAVVLTLLRERELAAEKGASGRNGGQG